MIANQTLRFAAVGDVHDHFGEMTRQLHAWSATTGHTLDFVLQVGDLQANRHAADLETMAAPLKFRHLGDFHLLWERGEALPWPFYFIGGNHEPYGWLDQHPDGAALMPNLHYLGRAGRVSIGGLQIAGMSGIYSAARHSESRPPVKDILNQSRKLYTSYNDADVVRAADFGHTDILMLHDWPQGVLAGQPASDWSRLKHSGALGNSRSATDSLADFGSFYGRFLIDTLRPALVFCGHMHCPHEAAFRHSDGTGTRVICLAEVGNRAGGAIRFFEIRNGGIEELAYR